MMAAVISMQHKRMQNVTRARSAESLLPIEFQVYSCKYPQHACCKPDQKRYL